jgi:hypothetical protein
MSVSAAIADPPLLDVTNAHQGVAANHRARDEFFNV